MLENYIKQNNGVIKQVDIRNKINYDFNYVNNSYNLDEDMIFMKTQLKELKDKQNIMLKNQTVILENQTVILENQTVMLKIINELHIKSTDVVSPSINLEITE